MPNFGGYVRTRSSSSCLVVVEPLITLGSYYLLASSSEKSRSLCCACDCRCYSLFFTKKKKKRKSQESTNNFCLFFDIDHRYDRSIDPLGHSTTVDPSASGVASCTFPRFKPCGSDRSWLDFSLLAELN